MFKPMLASAAPPLDQLRYPVLASPKLDGIRCIILNGVAVSRNLKPIQNRCISDILKGLPSLDGELIVGPPVGDDVLRRTSSGVMSRDGFPAFNFWVFDAVLQKPMPFASRLELAKSWAAASSKVVQCVPHTLIKDAEALELYEESALASNYEGIMVRDPEGLYKKGRSTAREGWLLKIKRFEDSEAIATGFEEQQENTNELTRDELGRAKRTSHKAGKRPKGVLGALLGDDAYTGEPVRCSSGLTDEEREVIWNNKAEFTGKTFKYKKQTTGEKDKPRHPVFLGWRDASDL